MMKLLLTIIVIVLCILPSGAQAYDEQDKRDPFWPLISASGTIINYGEDISPSDMVLEGIMSDGADKYIAIINGNIVKPGDAVGTFTIERIEPKTVFFIKGSETFEINLKNGGE